jgi:hypothetical protein
MTKEELWQIYCRKNPSFAKDGNVTMSAKGLRKLFDTTWDTAYYDGESEESFVENSAPNFQQDQTSVEFLKSIFGMR